MDCYVRQSIPLFFDQFPSVFAKEVFITEVPKMSKVTCPPAQNALAGLSNENWSNRYDYSQMAMAGGAKVPKVAPEFDK